MSLVNLSYVCSHLQNASRARLGLTSIQYTKLHLSIALLLQKQGLISHIKIAGRAPPQSFFDGGAADNPTSVAAYDPLSPETALSIKVHRKLPKAALLAQKFSEEAVAFAEEHGIKSLEQLQREGFDRKAIEFVTATTARIVKKAQQIKEAGYTPEMQMAVEQEEAEKAEAERLRLKQVDEMAQAAGHEQVLETQQAPEDELASETPLAQDNELASEMSPAEDNELASADEQTTKVGDEQIIQLERALPPEPDPLQEQEDKLALELLEIPDVVRQAATTHVLRPMPKALHDLYHLLIAVPLSKRASQPMERRQLLTIAGPQKFRTPEDVRDNGITLHAMGLDIHNQPVHLPNPQHLDRTSLEAEGIVTQENRASRRLWLGLKYYKSSPVLSQASLVSKPTKRITMTYREISRLLRGSRSGEVKPLSKVGEIMAFHTDKGVIEARECVERKIGGMALCRFA